MNYELICRDERGREVMVAGGNFDNRIDAEKVAASRIGESWGGKVVKSAEVIQRQHTPLRLRGNNSGGDAA